MVRVALLIVALAATATGQKVTVDSAVSSRNCVIGEEVLYGIDVKVTWERPREYEPPRPQVPDGDDYDVRFERRNESTSSSFSLIINGRQRGGETSLTTQFVFVVVPKKIGRVVIPSFEYVFGERKFQVPAQTLLVEKEAPGNRFVSVTVLSDKDRPYVNQPVRLRYELNTERLILTRGKDGELSRLTIPWAETPNGFYAEPLREQGRGRGLAVKLNEKPFELEEIQVEGNQSQRLFFERTVYPLAPGRVELGGTTTRLSVATRVRRNAFRRLQALETAKALINTEPLELEVRDAPTVGRPASYSGVIGDFEAELRLGETEIRAGDGVTLTLTLTGPGALGSLEPPELRGFDDFDVYPPDREITGEGTGRTMTFSWLVVPKSPDVPEIPEFEFSWFKPSTERFVRASIGPKELTITGEVADGDIFESNLTPRKAREIRTLGEGLRPIKENPGGFGARGAGVSVGLFAVAALLPLVTLVLLSVTLTRRRRLSGDERLVRRRRASKEATARLEEARGLLGARGFHGRLARSLSGFIGDKLGVPGASVSVATARELLGRGGVSGAVVDDVLSRLEELDHKEFGGAAGTESEQRDDLAKVEALISRLDKEIRS